MPSAAPSTAAVRKSVTALFCDLGGSTGFGERLDPELAREVMASYHAILQEVIDAHGGAVKKFMGDGMMATFGIPEVAEDDAARAVLAGADLQRRFEALAADVAQRHGETLTLRVGINTGEVVIAEGDSDLVGDALNVAARLEKACRPGQVMVGDETWRLTRGQFGYEPLGAVSVAGRAQPVATYELAIHSALAAEAAAPFVGREAEMRRLRAAFDTAAEARSAQLVTVLGAPGVGKTRLSRELCAAVVADRDALTFEVRCGRAQDATFAPIAQLIREAAGLGDDADVATARDRVGGLLPESETGRERLVEVLAGLVGAAPARSVEETFWAIRRLVESVAAQRAVVVVIDDIQWAEALLLDLLEHLVEWIRDAPVVLVGLARPELRDVRPSLTELGKRVSDVIALDGLDAAATAQLAAQLLGTDMLPTGLVTRLPASTDGNPLFVRELVRMLVDDEVIRLQDGVWELTIDADAVEVPPTIQSLLAARVERLPDDQRALLEHASVVGPEFSLGALGALATTMSRATIGSLLEAMRRKELVEPTGTYWGDEPVHRFHHVLIRDAAYRRLLKARRADLHEIVGVWTDHAAESLIGEHEAATAYHYEQAFEYRRELGRLDEHADGLGRRAAELLGIAAQRALDRDDLLSAGALARRALNVVSDRDTKTRAELLLIACECLLQSGDVLGGSPLVDDLAHVAVGERGLAAWADCYAAQLVSLTDPSGLLAAEQLVTRAAATLEALDDLAGQAKAHQVRAGLLARLGRVGDAEMELDLALGAARGADDRRRVTAVLGAAPGAALFGPSPVARAGGRCLDVVRLLRITTASPSVEATSMRCQAVLEALRGRFDVSRSMLASARAALEELGLSHGLLEVDLYAGMVELIADDPAAAVAPLRAAYGGLGATGLGADAGTAAALLARALLATGDIDEADAMASASESLAGQNLKTAIAWRAARAEVLAARGDITGVALAEAAVEIAAGTDLVVDHADACVTLAKVRDAAGDTAAAHTARADALRLYELKGATVPAQRLGTKAATPPARRRALDQQPVAAPRIAAAPTSETRTPLAENAAVRVVERTCACLNDGRFDELAELYAADFVRIDRRRGVSAAPANRQEFLASARVMVEVGFSDIRAEPIAVRGESLSLVRGTHRTTGGSEVVFITTHELDGEGKIRHQVQYDEDDLAIALEDLDTRYLADEGAAHATALRAGVAQTAAMFARDWDAVTATLAADFVGVDHRGLWPDLDRDGFVDRVRTLHDTTGNIAMPRKYQIAGLCALTTCDIRASGEHGDIYAYCFHLISVSNEQGSLIRFEWFDEANFDEALARLDELGPDVGSERRAPLADNAATRLARRACEWLVSGRIDELEALMTTDFARVDRRKGVSAPTANRDDFLASLRAIVEVGFSDIRIEPIAVRGERLSLSRAPHRTADGLEMVFITIHELDVDGRVRYQWQYDEDDLAIALEDLEARYLVGEGAEHAAIGSAESVDARMPWLDNTAMRSMARVPALARDGRWEEVADLVADDYVRIDHRTGTPAPTSHGPADFVAITRATFDVGFEEIRNTPLATRGERSALSRVDIGAADGPEIVFLQVHEWNASSQLVYAAHYDEADLTRALGDLDGRYLEGEGAPLRAFVLSHARYVALGSLGDWAGVRDQLAPDMVFVDRRAIGFPELDRDGLIDMLRGYSDLGDTSTPVIALVRNADRAMLTTQKQAIATPEGNEYEWLYHQVRTVDASGRSSRLEIFAEDEFDAALARFEELAAADPRTPRVENAASRLGERVIALANARRWDDLAQCCAPHLVRADRRTSIAAPTAHGPDEYIAAVRAIFDAGFGEIASRPLAVRGDRLVLLHVVFRSNDELESVFLTVAEIDSDGLVVRIDNFDEDDLAAAMHELEARYIADEGADLAPLLEVSHATQRTHVERDWVRMRESLTDDFRVVDHRSLGWPSMDADAFVAALKVRVEQVPDIFILRTKMFVSGNAILTCCVASGTTVDGNDYDWPFNEVRVMAHGRLTRCEYFDGDDFDAALARFDEIAETEPRTPRLENAATRLAERAVEMGNTRNWPELGACFGAGFVRYDHRTGIAAPTAHGPDEYVEAFKAIFEAGFGEITSTPIAIRGDRLNLARVAFRTDDGLESVFLNLAEVGDDGVYVRFDNWDDDNLTAAVDELEARYLSGEGAPFRVIVENVKAFASAIDGRDRLAYREAVSPDMVAVDRRKIGFGKLDADGFFEYQRGFDELGTEEAYAFRSMHNAGKAMLCTRQINLRGHGASEYEWLVHFVVVAPAGRISHLEIFAEDDFDAASARFDELGEEPAPLSKPEVADRVVVENRASRAIALGCDALNRGVTANPRFMLAPGVERHDRRRVVSAPDIGDAGSYVDMVSGIYETFGSIDSEVIAIRGDRLALTRQVLGREPDFVLRLLCLFEFDDAGRLAWEANYDEDQLVEALDELEMRYLAGEGAAHEDVQRATVEGIRAYRLRDWDRYSVIHAPAFRAVDHRQLGHPLSDSASTVSMLQQLCDLVPDVVHVYRTREIRGDVALTIGEAAGTTAEGSRYSWQFVLVERFVGRQVLRSEVFDIEQYAEARALFDQWSAETQHQLSNAATRLAAIARAQYIDCDWEAFAGHMALDVVMDDRRTTVSSGRSVGNDAAMALTMSLLGVGFTRYTNHVVAIRGERLALLRRTWHGDFDLDVLAIFELDETLRVSTATILFDPDDLDAAIAELDRRAILAS